MDTSMLRLGTDPNAGCVPPEGRRNCGASTTIAPPMPYQATPSSRHPARTSICTSFEFKV